MLVINERLGDEISHKPCFRDIVNVLTFHCYQKDMIYLRSHIIYVSKISNTFLSHVSLWGANFIVKFSFADAPKSDVTER